MTTIDCDTCPVRGRHCADCFVPVLGRLWLAEEQRLPRVAADGTAALDDAEAAAAHAFVRAGLVDPEEVRGLRAQVITPAWGAVG